MKVQIAHGEIKMDKKGIVWPYLIAGALAIIVLVVMGTVFVDTTGKNTKPFTACENNGGECLESKACSDKSGFSLSQMSCKKDQVCCVIDKDDS